MPERGFSLINVPEPDGLGINYVGPLRPEAFGSRKFSNFGGGQIPVLQLLESFMNHELRY